VVKIGDISKVQLQDGKAVVTMDIERQFLPIYRNATALIRPRTGLQDVFIELDPGTKGPANHPTGEFKDGDTIPLANTAPEVNLDQILSALDGDTRAYLRTLIVGLGQGLKGRSKDLGRLLGGLGPINKELARLNTEVATRRHNLADLIHNLNLLTGTVGKHGNKLRAARGLFKRGAGGDREGGQPRAARRRPAAGHAEHRARHLRQDRGLRQAPRPDLQPPAPVRAQSRSPQRIGCAGSQTPSR